MDIYAIAIWFYVAEEILYTAGIAGLQYRSVKARKPRITGFPLKMLLETLQILIKIIKNSVICELFNILM